MIRRLACNPLRGNGIEKALTKSKVGAVTEARRHLEPMSVWYLASWTCCWWYCFFFWFPVLWVDMFMPSFVYNKLPLIHFIQEKRSEQKLRRVLDETYTEWTTEIEPSALTEAISRTF
ncbi:unnamed protein product [Phytomonas sp. EM1]|nr:unnamed protein product [Phytomonas sp. EM1]|eukprot:CCW60529.1 unnamed protein product [Phytomonas sp. isolate EM1]